MRNYTYNKITKVLEVEIDADITIESISRHYKKLGNDDLLPRNLKVLIDCRGYKMNIDIDEINTSGNAQLKVALTRFNSIQEVILVDKPFETVVAILFRYFNFKFESYSFRVFSTEYAARNWIEKVIPYCPPKLNPDEFSLGFFIL
jgi:hypothetical protein